jgi:dynein heavy chain
MAENKCFGARGPAGTGKTETVKDLGRALGKIVVVFNCGPTWREEGIRKVVNSVIRSGCLVAFDELDRLTPEA